MTATDADPISFRRQLLAWYHACRRDLPWRGTRDPWAVWVSEVMLQQTRVETVRPRFSAFLAAFPTPAALAAATEETVLAHWSGLGYYERARRLRRGASVVADRPQGAFPRDPATARSIPGVGPYTAAAILSISFGLPLAVVDGNVARVLARLYRLETPHDRPGARTRMLAQALLDPAHPGDHNQAMMELGALVCLPANPACTATGTARGRCPVQEHCRAHAAGMTHRYPTKRRQGPPVEVQARLFLLRDRTGRLLVERDRWEFLSHLWLPVIRQGPVEAPGSPDPPRASEAPGTMEAPGDLPARFRIKASSLREVGRVDHTITKHRILLRVFTGLVGQVPGPAPKDHLLVTEAELAGLGRSSILEKALRVEQTAREQRPGKPSAARRI